MIFPLKNNTHNVFLHCLVSAFLYGTVRQNLSFRHKSHPSTIKCRVQLFHIKFLLLALILTASNYIFQDNPLRSKYDKIIAEA